MTVLILISISILGLILRIVNVSPFKFYPDSYQNLLVALNIQTYSSVVGWLGPNGLFYPDFFMWTRPTYPLLINLYQWIFSQPLEASAQSVSLITSVLAIPLAYFFISQLFKNRISGFVAACLIAISFNHIVWSGFIYTEASAIFMNLLFLSLLTLNISKKSLLADKYDLLTGFFFSLAIFSRYEYLILILPMIYLIWQKNEDPKKKLLNIFLGTVFTSSVILSQLFPVKDLILIIATQLHTLLWLSLALVIGVLVLFLINKKIDKYLPRFLSALIILITSRIVLQIIFGESIPFFTQFSAIKKFFYMDFLLAIFAISGLLIMLKKKESHPLAYFTLLSIALLWPIYNRINPDMARYWTHMLPFLLIPASFSATLFLQKHKNLKPELGALLVLIGIQTFVSWNGMKNWNEGIWFKQSYEEVSAKILTQKLEETNGRNENLILLTSMPESYFLYSRFSTQSIFDHQPFLNIPDDLNDKKIWIIQDIGMRDLFPTFNKFIDEKLQDKKIDQYLTGTSYKFGIKTLPEQSPVIIYELTLKELKERISR